MTVSFDQEERTWGQLIPMCFLDIVSDQSSVHFNLEMQYVRNMGLVGHCYSIFKYFAKELLQTEKEFFPFFFLRKRVRGIKYQSGWPRGRQNDFLQG